MIKKQLMLFAAVCSAVIISSCNTSSSDTNPTQSFFLIANISPDAEPLTVTINGSAFGSGLAFGNYTPYYSATPGSYQFAFSGTTSAAPLLTQTVTFNANTNYSCFVVDSFKNLKASFVEDDLHSTTTDSVYVRFFNFIPNSGPVALYDSAAASNIYTNRTFNDQAATSSYATFARIPKGVYTLQVKRIDGSLLASKIDTLVGGHTYSIFAKGFDGGTGTQAPGIGQIVHL